MNIFAYCLPAVVAGIIFPLMIVAFYSRSKTKGAFVGFLQGLILPIGMYYGGGKIDILGIVFFVTSVIAGYFWGSRGEKKKRMK